jgi:aerobic-type carbon monoxide dehydrogenase small subunit (CoxS/CutS family)
VKLKNIWETNNKQIKYRGQMFDKLRISGHPILDDLEDRKKVRIWVDGKEIEAFEGEPIAAALFAQGIKVLRHTPVLNEPRGVFCNRGRCTDCIMKVNGKPNIRTCITMVKNGMVIETLHGLGDWRA